jgi:dTDP-4-amino-4,6-dideoxygalactose transaminase
MARGTLKRDAADLAVCGGEPAFGRPLHVGRPHIGDRARLRERLDDLLDRAWLTNSGPYVEEFEQRVAAFVGAPHCVVMANATAALEVLIKALDLTGEVILPSFTFIATAHAVSWQRLTPVFCDIDPATHNLDARAVASTITARTSAIIGVHVWGRACDVDGLRDLAERHDLALVFDAAHAFGCTAQQRPIGSLGVAEVFSFHATKIINSFEGGAVTTTDAALAERLRLMRNFGFAGYDRVVSMGTNAKLSEAGAAMGLTSLESYDAFRAINQERYHEYRRHLEELPGITMISYDARESSNFQYVVVEVDDDVAGLSRDDLQTVLMAENVLARRYFYPGCHRMAPYASENGDVASLPNTDLVASRVLCLPSGSGMRPEEPAAVSRIIRTAVENAAEVSRRLRRMEPA